MNQKRKKQNKTSGFRLLLHTLKRVIRRDEGYIEKVSEFDENADYIKIRHNGTTDYGMVLYVIKENTGVDGFCATVWFVMHFLIFAHQHGFVPVIKLSKDFAYFDEDMSKEISNPWEYYFVSDENSYDENQALNVCYCDYRHMQRIRSMYDLDPYKAENYCEESIFALCTPYIQKYLQLKPSIKADASNLLKAVTENGGKVLGVHFRGTDYKRGYNNHPVFVDEKTTMEEIKKAMDTGRFAAVFLATDDASFYDRVREAMAEILVLIHPDVFRSSGNESVAFCENDRKNHHYLLGFEIARDMYTLSLCNGLVAGKSNVSFLSNLYKHSRNEAYEYMQIIDHGNNSNDNEYFKES